MDEGVSIVDAPAQASAGGAVKVEPPTEDRVSDTPQPVIDVESLDETVTIKEEGLLSTVGRSDTRRESRTTGPADSVFDIVQDEPSRTPAILDVSSPTPTVDSGSQETQMNDAQAKTYVADQVQRWEPLDEAWISDLQLVRSELPTTQDVKPIVIPPSMLSPRDCVALIQTLLDETGFSFRDVIPEWFRSRSSQIAPSAVRIAVEGVQHLLTTELIEWRQVAFGVTFQVVSIEDEPLDIQDYHAEDPDRDLLMTDHEAGLLECSRAGSDLVPSLFGTSGGSIESTRSGMSGSKSSQDESSSSSVWSLGQPAAGHMPFRAYAPMVMTAQGGAVQANTQMGMQAVQTILPPPPVMAELDDIVMSESGKVTIQGER
ncbi:hypothetical protein PHMEG_00035000, partial [Phytophthora megakarya]